MIVLYAAFLLAYELFAMATGRKPWTERSHDLSGLPVWLFAAWLPVHLILMGKDEAKP